jgi:hypothetical protein
MPASVPKFPLDDVLRGEYWRSLCPPLQVEGVRGRPPVANLLGTFIREGRLNIADVFPLERIARMRDSVVTPHSRGISPLFAFVYDEFVRGDAAVPEGAKQLLRPDKTPTFAERLGLLGRLLQQYERFQKLAPEITLIAKGLEGKNPTR